MNLINIQIAEYILIIKVLVGYKNIFQYQLSINLYGIFYNKNKLIQQLIKELKKVKSQQIFQNQTKAEMNIEYPNLEDQKQQQAIVAKEQQKQIDEYDIFFQKNEDTFTIQYGIKIIKVVQYLSMIFSLLVIIISIYILEYGGRGWRGHLPNFIENQFHIQIFLSSLIILISTFQIRKLDKIPLMLFHTISLIVIVCLIVLSSVSAGVFESIISVNKSSSKLDQTLKCENNFSLFWSQDLLKDYNLASTLFCSSQCPCQIQLENVDSFQKQYPFAVISSQGFKSLLQCDYAIKQVNSQSIQTIQFLENNWECSNICSSSNFYLFRKVDEQNILQNESCYNLLSNKINNFLYLILMPGLFLGIILLVGWVFQLYSINEIQKYTNYQNLISDALKTQESLTNISFQSQRNVSSSKSKSPVIQDNGVHNSKSCDMLQCNNKNQIQLLNTFEKQQLSLMNEEKVNNIYSRIISPKPVNLSSIIKDYNQKYSKQDKKLQDKSNQFQQELYEEF
ncbi:transmembrane protein, putative (macronuclear) [Tetrahymena thermophila SB210]|uniref:Transmembrane protein, putative n=1 Tax=Tetrahymena thermophila (strain SB210) TaxID=312017 RepID=Q23K96_TETTS|nr:transmembrane protein, putative [Tetrahymena thermophila SB210]EAR96947.2 transmembrane protein, putative [Tetrahymena thermophila SB210]|eukprot:XP_001017192.2 transmembrane protein, putative [Tetrahymena thermophila SB210]